jgi:peptide-methionine (S)-S-oxide reductase
MSWRLLTLSLLVTVVYGLSSQLQADDQATPAKGAATDKSAVTEKGAVDGTASAQPEKPAAAKAKSKKSSSRLKSRIPSETTSSPSDAHIERATFGAGCFWHVEDTFERTPGVLAAVSGYAGGSVPNPTYEMVHEGITGHAEVVMVEYDADVISYEDLLKVFWTHHDPTTPNRQGPDIGTQYRSIILYHNEAQRKAALKSYQDLVARRAFRYPIVTQLFPLTRFYRAEDYHQDYYGGKPRTAPRRRKTTTVKSKSAQSKKATPSGAEAPTEKPAEKSEGPAES